MKWTEFAVREARKTLTDWEKLHGKLQPPVPVEDIADLLYLLAIDGTTDLPSYIAGRLFAEDRIIEIRRSDLPVRQRLAIAHEIGHYRLHVVAEKLLHNGHACGEDIVYDVDGSSSLFEFELPISNISQAADSNSKQLKSEMRQLEVQASWFAAEILMPASLIENAVQRYGTDVISLANLFKVSVQAMSFRLEKLLFLAPSGPQLSFLTDL